MSAEGPSKAWRDQAYRAAERLLDFTRTMRADGGHPSSAEIAHVLDELWTIALFMQPKHPAYRVSLRGQRSIQQAAIDGQANLCHIILSAVTGAQWAVMYGEDPESYPAWSDEAYRREFGDWDAVTNLRLHISREAATEPESLEDLDFSDLFGDPDK